MTIIFSLNWILHNDAALVEKSMEDIKSYLDTMVDTKDTEMQVEHSLSIIKIVSGIIR